MKESRKDFDKRTRRMWRLVIVVAIMLLVFIVIPSMFILVDNVILAIVGEW
jgi:hypothetical protein